MFQLTSQEVQFLRCNFCTSSGDEFLRSKNLTSNNGVSLRSQIVTLNDGESLRSKNLTLKNGRGEHSKYLPYAFTEQGIYMLMTVLKGELAIKQSKALIRLFKQLKDYALETRETLEYRGNLELAAKILETQKDVETAKSQITQLSETTKKTDAKVNEITKLMSDVVKRSELSPLVMDFTKLPERNEFLIMNGELARANETYIDIYARATKSIYIVDDYIDIKTLRQLQKVKNGVKIVVFSDNVSHYLHKRDYNEFIKEFPDIKVKFIKSGREFHDRFIVLDDETNDAKVFHCGASSKDAGVSITMIMELSKDKTSEMIREVVRKMVENEKLELK